MELNLRNPWIVGGLLTLIGALAGVVIVILETLTGIEMPQAIGLVIGMLTALWIGMWYGQKNNEEMPRKLRAQSALITILIQGVLGALLVLIVLGWDGIMFRIQTTSQGVLSFFLGVMLPAILLMAWALIYYFLGKGSRTQLQALKKLKEKQQAGKKV